MIDALGHPITAGCTVLTAGYWNPTMSKVVKVKRVTKTKVVIELEFCSYNWKTNKTINGMKDIYRKPHQVVVIDKQLKFNRKKFPENLV